MSIPNLASNSHKTALTFEQLLMYFSLHFCQQEIGKPILCSTLAKASTPTETTGSTKY